MSLGLLLDMAAEAWGDRVALGSLEAGITFTRLAERAAGGGTVLTGQHASQAVLLARNGPIMPHVFFAAVHAGIPFIPLNYRLSPEQIRRLLAEFDAPFVVADADYLPIITDKFTATTTDEFLAGAAAAEPAAAATVDDSAVAVLLFTSGTTTKPKAVPLRHENLQAYVFGTVEFGSATREDAALVAVPPYHVAAISSVLSNLYAGRRVVYLPDFAADKWLDLARDERVTTAMVVPTMLARIVGHLAGMTARTPSLRVISYGGARMPVPVVEKALALFPETGFVNAYGLTETSSTIAILGPEEHRDALAATNPELRERLRSVGRPVPGIEMQIRDGSGAILGPDERGELWVRGSQVSGHYVGVGSVLDGDGWFPTHDRAWLDPDGYLFIEGRSDDTIIRGGENIAPAEIEDALTSHPAVAEAAVVGVADDQWGQRLVAAVVPHEGVTVNADELQQHVRRQLRSSRTPDEVIFLPELPYTTTGKLLRREIIQVVSARFNVSKP